MAKNQQSVGPKPVRLYDHIPEILVGPLALFYGLLSMLQYAHVSKWAWIPIDESTIFWVASTGTIAWLISYRWNLSKKNFVLVVALFGFLIGIPAVLEIVGIFHQEALGAWHPFATIGTWLGAFAPTASPGAYAFAALCGSGIWLTAFVWSRLHMSATLDESGLTIVRVDGKRERYELIGLKTEADPFDYSERAAMGIGSLTLQTRTGKMIFSMKRVIWLYRIPFMFWISPKIDRIENVLSYQGKTTVVSASERADLIEAMDDATDGDDEALDDDGDSEDHGENGTGSAIS